MPIQGESDNERICKRTHHFLRRRHGRTVRKRSARTGGPAKPRPRTAFPASRVAGSSLPSAAGVGAAALFANQARAAAVDREERPISIPDDIPRTLGEAPDPAEFPMNGAQVFARACAHEGLKALFCAPGNYQVINAIAAEGIPTYGGRTEGSMCAAADGFTRVTGEVAACSGTEGPGFTNMIMNIGAANAARTPLLVLASNMTVGGDDTERGIQRGYQQPTTVGMKKYGKRLITPKPGLRVRGLRLPAPAVRRAAAGASRLHRRGGASPVRHARRPALLPRQEHVPHRRPPPTRPGPTRRRQSR